MDDELQLLRNRVEKLERFSAGLYQVVGQCAVTAHATTLTTKAIGVYITNLAKVEGRLKPVIPLLEELEELALKLQASVREFDFNE